MATIQEILSGRNLTRMVTEIKSGLKLSIPDSALVPTDRFSGNTFEYLKVDGNRDVARLVARDAPARRVGMQGVSLQKVAMLESRESQAFMGDSLVNLISMEQPDSRQKLGEQEIARQTAWFKRRQVNLLQTAAQMMLFKFAIYADSGGNLLPTSSGAYISVDCGVPAGQLNQLDILGASTPCISASWGTAGTDIIGNLLAVREQMEQLGGWEMKHAWYGSNIPKYLYGNDIVKNWINYNPVVASQAFRANRVPEGFQDYTWHYAGDAFWIDAAGAVQKFLGPDEIVFTPDFSDDWWRYGHGSNVIPMGPIRYGQDAGDMLADVEEAVGPWSYASLEHNPVRIEQYAGVTFLPLIVATKSVCKADVTP